MLALELNEVIDVVKPLIPPELLGIPKVQLGVMLLIDSQADDQVVIPQGEVSVDRGGNIFCDWYRVDSYFQPETVVKIVAHLASLRSSYYENSTRGV